MDWVCDAAVHYLSTTWISEVSFLISVFFCCLALASCSKLANESYFVNYMLSKINDLFVSVELCVLVGGKIWIRATVLVFEQVQFFIIKKAPKWEMKHLQDQKNEYNCPNLTCSTSRWMNENLLRHQTGSLQCLCRYRLLLVLLEKLVEDDVLPLQSLLQLFQMEFLTFDCLICGLNLSFLW